MKSLLNYGKNMTLQREARVATALGVILILFMIWMNFR